MSVRNLALFLLTSLLSSGAIANGDLPFKGNRRPGILNTPTAEPTGENAQLYRKLGEKMGSLSPDQYLDFLSENPNTEDESSDEE